MSDAGGRLALAPRTYRWVDRATKLSGVALVAAGLDVGGYTLVGALLGAAGVTLGIGTVFIDQTTDSASNSRDE